VAERQDLRKLYARALHQRGFSADSGQRAVLARLELLRRRLLRASRATPGWLAWLKRTPADAAVRGLYIWGGVGRGKTWLMDLFFESLPFPERRRQHFHRFMHDVHAALAQFKHERDPLELVAAAIAREARVLCLDELQVTDIADAMILGGLFAGLFRRNVTLVTTSNTAPRDLYKDGLQRARFLPAIALIEKHCRVVQMISSHDWRLRALTQAAVYQTPPGPEAERALARIFTTQAEGAVQDGGEMIINDRPIPVRKRARNILWFDFAALCEGPRAVSDYIELAKAGPAVIISNVPQFTVYTDDAARRFVLLVDEFYDRHVKLILSAAAPITELYDGERLRAEFGRTESRLIEMQSEEYLASEHLS
jgi:cell division protein ZapE